MRRPAPSFEETVGAFRDVTATPAESAATRIRVLERAGHAARRRGVLKRSALAFAIALLVLVSGAALTAAALRWRAPGRAPAPAAVAASEPAASAASHLRRPTRVVPALAVEDPPSRPVEASETLAYERAHHAHFFADAPATALAAWDKYLAAFPRGTFAPEARYNRALCLVRLGRTTAAAQALRPFASGRLSGYRRSEACQLLRWLAERDAAVMPEPLCAGSN
jgi:TolA-binding protein